MPKEVKKLWRLAVELDREQAGLTEITTEHASSVEAVSAAKEIISNGYAVLLYNKTDKPGEGPDGWERSLIPLYRIRSLDIFKKEE